MKPLSILVVEDEFLIADLLVDLIEEAGHRVAGVAASAEEALSALPRLDVQLAILDIRLKGQRDGIELASELRKLAPKLAYMFISGSGEAITRARAASLEPVAILQKPFDHQHLGNILAGLADRL